MAASFGELFLIIAIVALVFGARLMPMLGEWLARRLGAKQRSDRDQP